MHLSLFQIKKHEKYTFIVQKLDVLARCSGKGAMLFCESNFLARCNG